MTKDWDFAAVHLFVFIHEGVHWTITPDRMNHGTFINISIHEKSRK